MSHSDYRLDGYGRPVHRDLDALAVEITKAAHDNSGRFPEFYEVPVDAYITLEQHNAKFHGGSPVGSDIGRVNFIWRGVPVCPGEI